MRELAPIILFTYNRPQQTLQTLNALALNEEAKDSILYIYCDGQKIQSTTNEQAEIRKVRQIVKNETRFKKIFITERDINLGLANSIIEGVTEIVNRHGEVIVLEDDILTSKFFLKYMNDALTVYKNETKVISIGGCNFFYNSKNAPSTFFAPMIDTWGWATWQDRWQLFEPNNHYLVEQIENKGLIDCFNFFGFYNFWGMLHANIQGKVSSWAISFHAVAFLNNMVTLFPTPSVSNHQKSDIATHTSIEIAPLLANLPLVIKPLGTEVALLSYYHLSKGLYIPNHFSKILKLFKFLKFTVHWIFKKERIKQNLLKYI
jgi:hypothetical protein